MFMFAFIFFYAPTTLIFEPAGQRQLDATLLIPMIISVLVIGFLYVVAKLKIVITNKITVSVFAYLIGLLIIQLSVYSDNVHVLPLIFLSFIPVVLLPSLPVFIVYNSIVVLTLIFTVVFSSTTVESTAESVHIAALSPLSQTLVPVIFIVGLVITTFIRLAIQQIFKDLQTSIEETEHLAKVQTDQKAVVLQNVAEANHHFATLSDASRALLRCYRGYCRKFCGAIAENYQHEECTR